MKTDMILGAEAESRKRNEMKKTVRIKDIKWTILLLVAVILIGAIGTSDVFESFSPFVKFLILVLMIMLCLISYLVYKREVKNKKR